MKSKLPKSSPNLILKNTKKLLFFLVVVASAFSVLSAQNSNANPNGTVHANENATVDGGFIETSDNTEVCVGDGVPDWINVTVEGASGRVKQWVITDDENNILALPENPPFDFDAAPPGNCRIWHLSYNGIKPLVDPFWHKHVVNLSDIKGKFDLSNYIEVVRIQQPEGGEVALEDGATEIEICSGDGVSDAFEVFLEGAEGPDMLWVVTDPDANIISTSMESNFDFEGARSGTCLIWNLSYAENVSLDGVTNANDLMGCFDLSNPITVIKHGVDAGDIEISDGTTEIEICAGDGESDAFDVNINGETDGSNFAWVITNEALDILDIRDPEMMSFDLEEAGDGVCLIWRIAFEGGLEGAEIGGNAADLMGCFNLSNAITVTRNEVNGGTISGGDENSFSFTVGDDTADYIAEGAVNLVDNVGPNSKWIVTNEDGTIIMGVADNYTEPNFNEAEPGTCLLWHLSYQDGIEGLEPVENEDHLVANLSGCFSLSNSISIIRTAAEASGKVALYPNPTKSYVTIDVSNFSKEAVNISVLSLQSFKVLNKTAISDKQIFVDVSGYSSGIYFVKVTSAKTGMSAVKRLVVD